MNRRFRLHAILFVLTTTTLALAGCSSSTTGGSSSGTSGTSGTVASLDGSYAGTYSGDDRGPVTMTISGTNIDVVATVGGKQYPASGALGSDGSTSIGLGAANGVTVTFQGSFSGGKGTGNWTSSVGTKGTWSVSK